MRTITGFERYGCFDLGGDRDFAVRLFKSLEGRPVNGDAGILHIDLVEKRNGLPMNLQMLICTIEQLGRNIELITRETFKRINLDEMPI